MKINAILLIKNEVDIVEEALLNAMKFCHRIYVCDNGSNDGSWALVNEMSSRFSSIVTVELCCLPFHQPSICNVYNTLHRQFSSDDWWYLLNADEVMAKSPEPTLKEAAAKGSNAVSAWCAEFYFTDEDLANFESEDTSLPFAKRRKFYRINNESIRFFKNSPDQIWSGDFRDNTPSWVTSLGKTAPVLMRFSERSPRQIQRKANSGHRKQNVLDSDNDLSLLTLKKAKGLSVYDNNGEFVLHKTTQLACYVKALFLTVKRLAKQTQSKCQFRLKKNNLQSTTL